MTTPASYSPGTNQEFGAGLNHQVNPGRGNANSVTLGGSLQADSDRWNAMSPHGVLQTALGGGSPAETDMGVELGQEAAGNQADADMAQQGFGRSMMMHAGQIGSSDGTA